jgi:hypothetical protein
MKPKITTKLEEFIIESFGHRIATAGKIIFTIPVIDISIRYGLNLDLLSQINISYDTVAIVVGTVLYGTQDDQLTTLRSYKKTKRKLLENKLSKEMIFKEMIEKGANKKLMGYCEQQGTYLAAKKLNYLEDFYSAKKKYSNVILPHF